MHVPDAPLVCICVPTYNVEHTIAETIRSLLAQTYANIVIYIVDNCSTDGTLAIARRFEDPRITVHANTENVGPMGNFDRCLALATGEYTALFHGDDVYEADIVERQIEFFRQHPTAGGVFTQARLIDETGAEIGALDLPTSLREAGPLYDFAQIFKAVLRHSNFMICPSFMARTEVYQAEIVTWRGDLFRSSADLDVWLRVLERHPCGILPDRLMRYRISGQQQSAPVRGTTDRSDFFAVTDYYLEKPAVRALLDEDDTRNYARLERRDRAVRSLNALLSGQTDKARELTSGLISVASFVDAFDSRRGLMTFGLAAVVRFSIALRASVITLPILRYLKKVSNR